jgi:putative isomerase
MWHGLGNYRTPLARSTRQQLSDRSLALLLNELRSKGHVHANYSAVSADSDDVVTTDWFYHWGALLVYVRQDVVPAEAGAPKRIRH